MKDNKPIQKEVDLWGHLSDEDDDCAANYGWWNWDDCR